MSSTSGPTVPAWAASSLVRPVARSVSWYFLLGIDFSRRRLSCCSAGIKAGRLLSIQWRHERDDRDLRAPAVVRAQVPVLRFQLAPAPGPAAGSRICRGAAL